MQKRLAALLLASTGSLLACDDTQEPVVPEPFHLRIVLEDPQGNPLPGLRVSAFNDVDEFVLPDRLPCAEAQSTAKPLGAASLRFCLPESASVRIVVRNVEDTPVRQLLDRRLPAGAHQLVWDTRDDAGLPLPGGVYEFDFQARVPTGQVQVSDLALFHRGVDEVLGLTDADGSVTTKDRKRFPSLYALDSLHARTADGSDAGAFRVLDRITIVAVDPLAQVSQCFTTQIVDAPQELRLTWDPASPPVDSSLQADPDSARDQPSEIPIPPPGDWQSCTLQVFPNPFN